MKSVTRLACLFLFMLSPLVNAQECPMYFPDQIGTVREMKSYDQRDRLTSITRQEIIDKTVSGNDVRVTVRTTSFDNDENEILTGDLEIICEDGVFRFDLRDYLDPNTLAAYDDMGIEITADNLLYPANMSAGDQLPDGELQMVVKSGQATILTMVLTISNRKIEGIEDITTDAGTFSCYKISYDISTKAGFITTSSSAVEWLADGVGFVRNETYNRRGRLTGYSVLTDLRK